MVLFNYSTKELTAKIVYYGPGLCGKTTNLQYIFNNIPPHVHKGKMLSLATQTDRTLFFDFLPIELGMIRGMKTRLQLYTVPGQVFYNTTRKLVLKGADGVVFVADSQRKMVDANIESYRNLEENLREHGMKLEELPHILQFNKRDLDDLLSPDELNSALNKHNAPIYESVATTGIGVQETLKAVTRLVLNSLREKYGERKRAAGKERPAAAVAAQASSPSASVAAAAAEAVLEAAPEAPSSPGIADETEEALLTVSEETATMEIEEPVLTVNGEADAVEIEEPVLAAAEETAALEIEEPEDSEVSLEEPSPVAGETPILLGEETEAVPVIEEESPLRVEGMESPAVPPIPDLERDPLGAQEDMDMESVLQVEEEPVPAAVEEHAIVTAPPGASPETPVQLTSPGRDVEREVLPPATPQSSQVATFPVSLSLKGETVHLKITITLTVEKA